MASQQGSTTDGYRGHRRGSRKERIRRIFDTRGRDAAFREGRKKDLKDTTLRSWMSSWKTDRSVSRH